MIIEMLWNAQDIFTVSGGEVSCIRGTASFTTRQIAYNADFEINGSVDEGVQKVFEIFTVTGIEENRVINLDIYLYPNPIMNYITLSTKKFDIPDLSYFSYDSKGKLLFLK